MNDQGKDRYNGHTLSECDTPVRKNGVLYIERLTGGQSRKYVIYSPHLKGFFTHYTGDKTVPCFKDHTKCPGGHKQENRRQYFLLHAWSTEKKRQVFVYLTPLAADQLLNQKPDGCTFRGRWLSLSRTASDQGRLNASLGEAYHSHETLPEEADPYPSIFNWMKIPLPDNGPHHPLDGDPAGDTLPI
jgi:hypothetical protein